MSVVIDLGSYETRCGFGDEHAPCYVHRTVSSRGADGSSHSFGTAAVTRSVLASSSSRGSSSHPSVRPTTSSHFKSILGDSSSFSPSSTHPIVAALADANGREVLTQHVRHCYNELIAATAPLAFAPNDAPQLPYHFVLPEAAFGDGPHSSGSASGALEAFVGLMMECPDGPSALYASRPSVAATLASGRASGVVLDVGHAQSTAVAVVDGVALRGSVRSSMVGGDAVNSALITALALGGSGAPPLSAAQLVADCYGGGDVAAATAQPYASLAYTRLADLCHNVKVRGGCYVSVPSLAADHSAALGGAASKGASLPMVPMYVAPDGQVVSMPSSAQSQQYECLFRPQHAVMGEPSEESINLGALVTDVKRTLTAELQANLPLLLCGGTSAANGFQDRLLFELKRHDLTYTEAHALKNATPVIAPQHSLSHLHWGGAALASSSTAFAGLWISRAEYAEEGVGVIRRKLFQ